MDEEENKLQAIWRNLSWLIGRPYPNLPHLRGNIINGRLSSIREEDGILKTLFLAKPLIEAHSSNMCSFWLGNKKVLIITKPEDIYNLKIHFKEYINDEIKSIDSLHDDNQSILTEANDNWRKKRNEYKHYLSIKKIQPSFLKILGIFINYLNKINGERINIKDFFDDFFIKINQNLLLGLPISSPGEISELSSYKEELAKTLLTAPYFFGIEKPNEKKISNLKEYFSIILKIFPRLLNQKKDSLINTIGKINSKWNKEIQAEDIFADLNLLILAGTETNSFALQVTIYLLSNHSKIEKKMIQELKEKCPLSFENINQLKYLDRIIKEVFRLYPPAPFILPREIKKSLALTKHVMLEKGDIFLLSPFLTHRLSQIWESPDDFNPDRFMESRLKIKGAYIPFGIGDRVCPGERFAISIIKFFIAYIYTNYQVRLIKQPSGLSIHNSSAFFFKSPPIAEFIPYKESLVSFEKNLFTIFSRK